ncbi:hypothetical protein B0T14DRAFT_501172 [Immersiella caudata]|uniref:Uncharacterized protein n=1 Tax=Immersiella caudata TaxID=314043 RepID=A0AA39WBH4_9PEZI|nr:hypothetical protein B0T14DRAFT_501172 [Immersiella caudata]
MSTPAMKRDPGLSPPLHDASARADPSLALMDSFQARLKEIEARRNEATISMSERMYECVVEHKRIDQAFVDEHTACLEELTSSFPEARTLDWAAPCVQVPDSEMFACKGIIIKFHPASDPAGFGPKVHSPSRSPSTSPSPSPSHAPIPQTAHAASILVSSTLSDALSSPAQISQRDNVSPDPSLDELAVDHPAPQGARPKAKRPRPAPRPPATSASAIRQDKEHITPQDLPHTAPSTASQPPTRPCFECSRRKVGCDKKKPCSSAPLGSVGVVPAKRNPQFLMEMT